MKNKYEQIKNDFLSGKIKGCKNFFESNGYMLEVAYCHIILGNLSKAKKIFSELSDIDSRAHWGVCLVNMLDGACPACYPTYFEVRNFLEIDLGILLVYCMGDYIERVLKYVDYMACSNSECYKFIGRVFWAYNYMPASMFFLRKACNYMYKDPELHYLLAYIYYFNINNIEDCKKELNICLNILPEYAPAISLMKKINASH